MPYWVQFEDNSPATVNAVNEKEARELAATRGKVTSLQVIPYPRDPQVNFVGCPSYCYGGVECLGKTACPQRRSCCD